MYIGTDIISTYLLHLGYSGAKNTLPILNLSINVYRCMNASGIWLGLHETLVLAIILYTRLKINRFFLLGPAIQLWNDRGGGIGRAINPISYILSHYPIFIYDRYPVYAAGAPLPPIPLHLPHNSNSYIPTPRLKDPIAFFLDELLSTRFMRELPQRVK